MTVNVRVDLPESNLPSSMSYRDKKAEKEKAFRTMLATFKKRVAETGIITKWKQKQFFESKADKTRRKRRQSELERKKNKLREHFG